MNGPVFATGLKFKIGKYNFRIWKTGWEFGDSKEGRMFFFWWHPIHKRRREFLKTKKSEQPHD